MEQKELMNYLLKMESIAKIGLLFSKDPYAIDNYQQMQALTKEYIENFAAVTVEGANFFKRDIYPTPSISVRTVILNDKNEVLLVQEKKTGLYSLPGGWADLYDSPSCAAIREVNEEAGVDVELISVIGVLDRLIGEIKTVTPEYVIAFKGRATSEIKTPCYEISHAGYFPLNALPPLSAKLVRTQFDRLVQAALENKTIFD